MMLLALVAGQERGEEDMGPKKKTVPSWDLEKKNEEEEGKIRKKNA